MKRLVFVLLLLLSKHIASSQNVVGKSYVTNLNNLKVVPVDEINFPEGTNSLGFYYVKKGTKFSVDGIDKNNNLVISFWPYKRGENKNDTTIPPLNKLKFDNQTPLDINKLIVYAENESRYNYQDQNNQQASPSYIGSWAGSRQFIMPLSSFNVGTQQYFGSTTSFNWGIMTLPIKVRFGNKDTRYFTFEQNLNLGFTAGVKRQFQGKVEQAINLLGGFGVTNSKLDKVSLASGPITEVRNELALSFNFGILYQYEIFQIGLFTGKDFLPSELSRDWKHQSKTWLGLAIGVSLFSRDGVQSATGKNGG